MRIDLNCDLGEGCPHDADLMPLITSANIACGAHAGEPATMTAALRLAKENHVQIGAHPGFPDRENFGRTELPCDEERIWQDCVYQIGALVGLATGVGVPVRYVKPHGALYNLACRDRAYAQPVVRAAKLFDLAIMGLPESQLKQEAKAQSVAFIAEGFADRRYRPDGSLVPRTWSNAFVSDPKESAAQVDQLMRSRGVQTICVHGDNPRAIDFVRHLRDCLRAWGFEIRAFEVTET
jgi:UPF0271 protein